MEELFENWTDTKEALLEGLNRNQRDIVSPLLENQKSYVMNENAATGSTQAHDIAGFRKILIPMIRRVIPGTIASELVGVQPMSGPVGLVYTLRYRYAENVQNTSHPNTFNLPNTINQDDEVFGNSSPIRQWYSGAAGDGSGSPGEDSAGQVAGAGGLGATDSNGDTVESIDNALASGAAWPSSLAAHDTSHYGPYAENSIPGHPGHAGSLYGGSGSYLEGSGGRKMTLDIVSQAVEAGSRKLQAGWTIEAMQDLNAQHGLDLESEMTRALSAEIVQEIDQEIITDLLALAGTVDSFDGRGAGSYGASGSGNYAPAYVGDRLANLGVIINRVANEIGRKTRRGVGNYIVVSPMIVSVLQSAAKSVFAPAVEGSFKGPNNTQLVGTLNGQIKVYSYLWNQAGAGQDLSDYNSPAAVDDTILVGFKGGNGETDAGYFYCPYIPLMSSGVVVNPVTFQPVVSLMTRYGKSVFTREETSLGNSADYYGKINVNALDLL